MNEFDLEFRDELEISSSQDTAIEPEDNTIIQEESIPPPRDFHITLPTELASRVTSVSRGAKLIVVSNREPIIHEKTKYGLHTVRPASGMVTALEPVVNAVGGTWIAYGSGSGDRLASDSSGRFEYTHDGGSYTLRRVWLSRQEEDGYYYGLSNGALWPLCHIVYQRPEFSSKDWESYRKVNEKFAQAVLEEAAGHAAIVFIQDYQLGLLPRILRNQRPDLILAQFWHIPWPNREAFRIFPWGEELLDGMLGNDVLGFHVQYHCNNFIETVDRSVEAKIDYENSRVSRGGHPTIVRPFPISVEFHQIEADSGTETVRNKVAEFQSMIGPTSNKCLLFVGADRIDYTKGIVERMKAFELLLLEHPELRERVLLIQLGAPSRLHLDVYRDLNDQIDDLVDDINWRHQTDEWQPIHLLRAHHDYYAVLASYQMATVGLATSLHDGMNLVAKEFIASRVDGRGVLILSQYTGAARELIDALLVNPYDIEELAAAMYRACTMPEADMTLRMARLREQVARNNVYDWGIKIFDEIDRVLQS